MKTCKEHSENPVFIYAQCAGCEVARYRKNEESMKQEIESLKKDAARYRWIKSTHENNESSIALESEEGLIEDIAGVSPEHLNLDLAVDTMIERESK